MEDELAFYTRLVSAMLAGVTPWDALTREDVRAALLSGSELRAADADAVITHAITAGSIVDDPRRPGILRVRAAVRHSA